MAFNHETWLPAGTIVGDPIRTTGGSADSAPQITPVNFQAADASIQLSDSDKALLLNVVTSTTRDAIIATPGMIAYNTTTGFFEGYDDSDTWNALGGGGGGLTAVLVTAATQQMDVNSAYYVNRATLSTLTLPVAATLGDVIEVIGVGAGTWSIAQNAGQSIRVGVNVTTVGVGGSLSGAQGEAVILKFNNTIWEASPGPLGNLVGV